jgi:hypothetical protein
MSKARSGAEQSQRTQSATSPPENDALSRDEIFEMLSNRRRRYALHCLQQRTERVVELGDISEQVAAWETDQRVPDVSRQERKRVYTSLQQFHLPKMEEKGVVEFDTGESVVELGDAASDIDIYLEVTDQYEFPWSAYYLGFAGISALLVSLSWAGVPLFASVSNQGWIAFMLTALTLFAFGHTVYTHIMRLGESGAPPDMKQ